MAKKVDDSVLDQALSEIRTHCDMLTVCAGEPADYAAAAVGGGAFLADVAMAPGDFTLADGTVSGRKLVIAAKSGLNVDVSGTADHVALLDSGGSRLLYVTTCGALGLTAGSDLSFGAWDIEIADPAP